MKGWEEIDELRWGWSPDQVLLLEWGVNMGAWRWKGPWGREPQFPPLCLCVSPFPFLSHYVYLGISSATPSQ